MRASVIIPNYNGERFLGGCLDSLESQTRRPHKTIVVDNGSSDRSLDMARGHPVRPEVISLDENKGFACAANAGLRAADTEAVALLNNDAVTHELFIQEGLRAMELHPLVSMFACLMLDYERRDRVDSAGNEYGRDGRPRPRGRGLPARGFMNKAEVMCPCAGAAFFRRGLFDEVGLFEEGFFSYLEDIDLGLRARSRGHVCMFVPGSKVYHVGAGTDLLDRPGGKRVDSSERVHWIARNRVRVVARNWPTEYVFRWMPWLVFGIFRSAAYHAAVSRQIVPFIKGLADGARLFSSDRAYFQSNASDTSFREIARLMREGSVPWTP